MELADEILGITEAKTELPSRIKRLQSGHVNRVVIVRQNHPVAVILSAEEYDRIRKLEAAEEFLEDAKALIRAKKLDDGTRVSLDEIKAELRID